MIMFIKKSWRCLQDFLDYPRLCAFRNDMQETVAFLRVQHEKHICVQNELDRKTNELRKLKEETKCATQTVGAKEQQIKNLESHFVIRRYVKSFRCTNTYLVP